MTTLMNMLTRSQKKGVPCGHPLVLKAVNRTGSVGGTTVVGRAGDTVAGTFTAAVVAELALLELAGIGPVAFLLFLLQISALGHALSNFRCGLLISLPTGLGSQSFGAGVAEAPILHAHEAIGDVENAGVMGDHQHGTALLARQALQQLDHLASRA